MIDNGGVSTISLYQQEKFRANGRKFLPEAIQGLVANQSSPPAHADGDLFIGSCGVWLGYSTPQ
jgi:hypothetical protein